MCDFFFHPTHFFLACVIFWLRQAHFSMFSRCYYFHSFYIFFCSVIHCSSQCAHRLWLSFIAWSTWSSSCVGRDTPFLLSPHLNTFCHIVLFLIEDKSSFFWTGCDGWTCYLFYIYSCRTFRIRRFCSRHSHSQTSANMVIVCQCVVQRIQSQRLGIAVMSDTLVLFGAAFVKFCQPWQPLCQPVVALHRYERIQTITVHAFSFVLYLWVATIVSIDVRDHSRFWVHLHWWCHVLCDGRKLGHRWYTLLHKF